MQLRVAIRWLALLPRMHKSALRISDALPLPSVIVVSLASVTPRNCLLTSIGNVHPISVTPSYSIADMADVLLHMQKTKVLQSERAFRIKHCRGIFRHMVTISKNVSGLEGTSA